METKKSSATSIISSILMVAFLLPRFAMPVIAQQPRPIVITFGQPNIWSLEQAHYLLSRMHRQNLDLQTAALGSLDPNETNAQRIDILKTLLQAGVSFDQAVGLNNELLRRDKEFNSDRRQQLLNNRSALQAESTQLARDISALKSEKARTSTDEERATFQASVDAKTEEKAAVDSQLTQTNDELKGLTSATGNFESANLKDLIPSTPTSLKGDLDTLISKIQPINPSIAATLRLDNHIGMQYEIISKQLTLLRDEVGPGERLVFLELPQSINATQDRAENKMAQTWWRIAGYTTVDKEWMRTKELQDLLEAIQKIDVNIATNDDLVGKNNANKDRLIAQLKELCDKQKQMENEQQDKTKKLDDLRKKGTTATSADREKLCVELIHDLEELQQSLEELKRVITATRSGISKVDDQLTKIKKDRARLSGLFTSLSTKYEKLKLDRVRVEIREQQNTADRLLQGGGAKTTDVVEQTFKLLRNFGIEDAKYKDPVNRKCVSDTVSIQALSLFDKDALNRETARRSKLATCDPRTFHNLEEVVTDDVRTPRLKTRSVRTIDIIPRQNAINVHDTKQRLSRTGIFAALSFLFGFAGKFSYERQRETAEQFLNQELFTSGFGKGEKDFGWSFFPFAGTRQLSSGVRTTYAVAVIPEDAESLVLKAKGCYFPRKENQPLDYNDASHNYWTEDNRRTRMCSPQEEIFVLPVPGGSGDGADYYVTELRFTPNLEPGTRMVASIHGQNLPSQVGILIDGVPLREAVGLGQLNIESILSNDKTKDNCVGEICGRFERIDANEIVISFNMPGDYKGTPRIGLIGPGRTLELNKLSLTINYDEDLQLSSYKNMFGPDPDSTLRRISDFKVAPLTGVANRMGGVLTGGKFKSDDTIFVNGAPANKVPGTCRDDLCIVHFDTQETDYLTVTISPAVAKEKTVSKTFLNPRNLSIISASVAGYVPGDPPAGDILTVKLEGSGFKETLQVSVVKSDGSEDRPQKIVPSAGQMFLKIRNPEAVVQINVVDPATNRIVTAVVARPEPPPNEDNESNRNRRPDERK